MLFGFVRTEWDSASVFVELVSHVLDFREVAHGAAEGCEFLLVDWKEVEALRALHLEIWGSSIGEWGSLSGDEVVLGGGVVENKSVS